MPAGTLAMLALGAANRDPAASSNPTNSNSTGRTCAIIWHSDVGLTPVPVRSWRAWKRVSRSSGSSSG